MRSRAFLGPGRFFRVLAQGLFLTLFGLAGPVEDAHPEDASSRPAPGPDARGVPGVGVGVDADVKFEPVPTPPDPGGDKGVAIPRVEMGAVTIKTEPPAVAGARMVLKADPGIVEGAQVRWSQVEGPRVEIEGPTSPSMAIRIPKGTEQLGFLLVATRPELVRIVRVIVPVLGTTPGSSIATTRAQGTGSWGPVTSDRVRADAGEDQGGLVGHRVTLNGTRSVPSGGKSARWVKVEGPAILDPRLEGPCFTFVPSGVGVYRFLLLVSGEGEISEPDEVAVLVGNPPSIREGTSATETAPEQVASRSTMSTALPLPDQILSERLGGLPGGGRIASDVADVLKAISDRVVFYSCFGELQSELGRRLDVVIPAEPSERAAWSRGIFQPLTSYTAAEILGTGLDLRSPQGFLQPLTPVQQERVGEHFQDLARAFRATSGAR